MQLRCCGICLLLVSIILLGAAQGARIRREDLQPFRQHQQHYSGLQEQLLAETSTLNDYYHYQDELARSPTSGDALAPTELEERNAYVVEDPNAGRTAVIEREARPLPGGGRMFWMRKTAPGSDSVTTVISGSSSSSSSSSSHAGSAAAAAEAAAMLDGAAEAVHSSWGLPQQLTQHMFAGAFSSAFAPLNDLLDAIDAQQQRLGSMVMSPSAHAAAAAAYHQQLYMPHQQHDASQQQQQQHMHHGVHHAMHHNMHHASGVPCPRHQALVAAAADAARVASDMSAAGNPHLNQHHQHHQQQQQQDGEVLDLDSLFSQQDYQQREQARAEAEQQQLQEELAAAGLSLSAHGAVVPLLLQPLPQQQQQHAGSKEIVYVDYAEDESAAAAAKLEAFYDTTDDDYAFVPASLDGVIPRLDDTLSSSSSSSFADGLDVDAALLVLLVAATAGTCLAFLQSLLQLRDALHAQQHPAAAFMLNNGKPLLISAVAGARYKTVSNSVSDNAVDELTQPLLVSPRDSDGAQEEQQQQQQGAAKSGGVQCFYNPLCYQQLSGGQV